MEGVNRRIGFTIQQTGEGSAIAGKDHYGQGTSCRASQQHQTNRKGEREERRSERICKKKNIHKREKAWNAKHTASLYLTREMANV